VPGNQQSDGGLQRRPRITIAGTSCSALSQEP
jgi:hypothetical protein